MRTIAEAWFVVGLLFSSAVHGTTGRYGHPCLSTYDCEKSLGLVCNKDYFGGCTKGICFCTSDKTWDESVRKCKTVKRPNQVCSRHNDLCTGKSMCLNGVCRCPEGMSTSQDPNECLPTLSTKIVGKACTAVTDVCYHNSDGAYVPGLAQCIDGICQCMAGYSQDGITCRPKRVGEKRCKPDTCVYGASCRQNTEECVCPGGKIPARGGEECVSTHSYYNLAQGEECDDYSYQPSANRVCNERLTCSQCPGATKYTCIKFGKKGVPSTEGSDSSSSEFISSSARVKTSITWISAIIFLLLYINR